MGLRITKTKRGKYNVYNSVNDKYLLKNAKREDVIEVYIVRAQEWAKYEIERWLDMIDEGIDYGC
jgi:hypothetical protein